MSAPTSPELPFEAQASIRRSAPVIAGGVAGASIIALLAVSSVVAPALAGGATLATFLAWLGGLGGNALASWLMEWASANFARFEGDDPDRERLLLEQLARDLTAQLERSEEIAADTELLIACTDAVAVALEALTGQAEQQAQLLQTLLDDLQRARMRNEHLHETILRSVEASTRQILAAQAQGHSSLGDQLRALLAAVERFERQPPGGVSIAGGVGNLQSVNVTGGSVGEITNQKITYILPERPHVQVRVDEAMARLRKMPHDTIPDLAPLPPGSRMSFRRNPLFVGREGDLRTLARALAGGGTVAIGQVAAATGLGGIGKTNLATEFVHRYGQFFAGGVCWLSFADPAAIPAEVAACGAGLIDRPDWAALKPDDQVRLVRAAWEESLPRLLIFDNCDDTEAASAEDLLREWCPTSGGARVLVTSRRGAWDEAMGVTRCALGVLAREESITLLRKLRPTLSDAEADAIAAVVGDLPLALHLSGSFLKTYLSVTPEAYVRDLGDALLAHPALEGRGSSYSPTDHERHVAKTFSLSYNRLDPADPTDTAARALLARAACLAPGEPIPRDLLLETLTLNGTDTLLAEDGLGRLIALGLLDEELGGALTMHRLISDFAQAVIEDEQAEEDVERAVIRASEHILVVQWAGLIPALFLHLQFLANRTSLEQATARTAKLYLHLGRHLHLHGRLESAKDIFIKSLAIFRQHDPESDDVSTSLQNLSVICSELSHYEEALGYAEQGISLAKQLYGSDSINVAFALNNLATVYRSFDPPRALLALQEAVTIFQRNGLASTPFFFTLLNNLALQHQLQGNSSEAEKHYLQAMSLDFPMENRQYIIFLTNLGSLIEERGDLKGALPFYERALEASSRMLEPGDLALAILYSNIGSLYAQLGDLQRANEYLLHAIIIKEDALGKEHVDLILTLGKYVKVLQQQGRTAEAESLTNRIISIEQKHGMLDAKELSRLHYIAQSHLEQGNLKDSREVLYALIRMCYEQYGYNSREFVIFVLDLAYISYQEGNLFETIGFLVFLPPFAQQTLRPEDPEWIGLYERIARTQQEFSDWIIHSGGEPISDGRFLLKVSNEWVAKFLLAVIRNEPSNYTELASKLLEASRWANIRLFPATVFR